MAIQVKEGNKNVRKLARPKIKCQFPLNHNENICLKGHLQLKTLPGISTELVPSRFNNLNDATLSKKDNHFWDNVLTTTATYGFRIFGLAEYFQEIIIRKKVEARENLPLGLQVHVE